MPVTVSSLLHDEMDDAICNPAVVVHDAAAHQVGATATELPDSQHCVFCHAFQSLRAISAAMRFAVPYLDARLAASTAVSPLTVLHVSYRPARAPPVVA
jgi:hypothetical protein